MSQNPKSHNYQPLKINAPISEGGGEVSVAQYDGRTVRRGELIDQALADGSNYTQEEREAAAQALQNWNGAPE